MVLSDPVLANGAGVGRDAGMIFPVASDSVQLFAEFVNIRLPDDRGEPGHATCRYVLRNLAATRCEFEMAFVTNAPFVIVTEPPRGTTAESYRRHYVDAGFEVLLDGTPLEVGYAAVARGQWTDLVRDAPDSLPVWNVTLEPHVLGHLQMKYDVDWSGGSEGGHRSARLTYHALPAALWAGHIEWAEIHFELAPLAALVLACGPQLGSCFSVSIDPPGYEWSEDGLGWCYQDWEPTTDFSFSYRVYRKVP